MGSSITDIDFAIASGLTICTSSTMASLVLQSYPTIKLAASSVNASRDEVFHNLHNGECSAVLAPLEDLQVFWADTPPKSCNSSVRGMPVLVVPKGLPLFEHVEAPLTYHMQKLVDNGFWQSITANAQPTSNCAAMGSSVASLRFEALSGSFVVLFMFASLGFIVTASSALLARVSQDTEAISQDARATSPGLQYFRNRLMILAGGQQQQQSQQGGRDSQQQQREGGRDSWI